MPRPSKAELLARFFPEIKTKASRAEREQAIAYNTLACEVVLADLLRLFDQGHAAQGDGVLCLRLHSGANESSYLCAADLAHDREMAAAHGDTALEASLQSVLTALASCDPAEVGLVLLVDNSSLQLLPISRHYPARTIETLLQEFSE